MSVNANVDDYLHLPALPLNTLGGKWKLALRVVSGESDENAELLAHINVGKEDEWIPIAAYEERDEL